MTAGTYGNRPERNSHIDHWTILGVGLIASILTIVLLCLGHDRIRSPEPCSPSTDTVNWRNVSIALNETVECDHYRTIGKRTSCTTAHFLPRKCQARDDSRRQPRLSRIGTLTSAGLLWIVARPTDETLLMHLVGVD
jgi:hypothetical protein